MDISLLKQVVQSTNKIALSTAVNNEADVKIVKIVNFVWYEAQPDTLYFSSVKTSPALKVYDQNPDIAFITIPNDGTAGNPYLRAQHVKLQRSTKTMTDLLPQYLETVPNYQQVWDAIGSTLVVFELKLTDLFVDAGVGGEKQTLTFN
ncbi:pyridoxamine 5'-phosphate oxidase [Lactiplantibacillus plantarum]|uniref:pyridoxamine 5'-phosphate oxidase n=1 Tax=Lactiplantibacillus plantarum TaxID=1590 RepID=UPI0011C8FA16|nr:pyridoxamine 5'-phosphate oxidase [Lactiplantibacillus plantarum]MCW6147329.1 pyridoxamine 5'-phosphate oxidase [Lactiplantibacillus plantarum]TXJ68169.1 pyridoxamine 5'-phosphate oxidase [Lactiplantibacillus plantarum]TXJ71905.1 pyridoxamine 5'-phosphate oxidase [Lactiplantibacillus plantarum]TXJ94796.1 pyridoxamine 5'-phosphate oxidase [Lactiplantibacillus plantarum]